MNGTAKIYLDGNLLDTKDTNGPDTFTDSAPVTNIGAYAPWSGYVGGLIDNLRIYNYQVPAEDIVAEYYDVTGNPGCIEPDFSVFNVNQLGSSYCKVTLADFAEFGAAWLTDGLYTP